MNYSEALIFLNKLVNYEKGFEKYNHVHYYPEKVAELLKEAGLSTQDIRIIHIAGTKGKGSTAYYTAKLLELFLKGGKNSLNALVGLYTSPHLFKLNERIKVDFLDISDDEFADITSKYAPLLSPGKVTYFEALTFIAMVYFIQKSCLYIVLETGLGGRLDSTNFCDPVSTVITSIGYDHTELLGKTLPEIASEKAGIIKRNKPVVCAAQEAEALKAIREKALELEPPFYYLPDCVKLNIKERNKNGSLWDARIFINGKDYFYENIALSQLGDVFIENFLLSLLSMLVLGIEIPESGIREAAILKIPFRMELKNNVLFDVSHNDASFENLFRSLRDYIGASKINLYAGILADKELDRIALKIAEYHYLFQEVYFFDFQGARKCGSANLYEKLKHLKNVHYSEDISLIQINENELNVFTGSFYIAEKIYKKLAFLGL
jgi:dihydrofolate synthase/folylpolyglutamate synthase